jgi:prohibitin 1
MTFIILSAILILVIFVVAGIKRVNGNRGWKVNSKQWLAVIGLLLAIPAFFTVVPANSVGIVYSPFSGGVQENMLDEGINAKGPFDTVYMLSTEVQTNQLVELNGQTRDSQYLNISIDVKYIVDPKQAVNVFRNFRSLSNVSSTLVRPAAQRAIESALVKYNIIEILGSKRSEVYVEIENFLTTRLKDNGLILHSITFLDTDGGEEIEQKIRDEAVEKKAGETALLRKARAETEAETRIIQAEAEAKEKEILAAAISKSPEILELEWIKKWSGMLPIYMSDGTGGVMLDLSDLQEVTESMTPVTTPAPTPQPTEQASE